MIKKLLEETVAEVIGRNSEEIVELIYNKKHVNEFILAKKLDITINQTRNILYKLSDKGLVSSIRKKDKKKGWYTYFWKLEVLKCLEFLKKRLIKKVNQINHQINSRETKEFYICERCKIEVNEENALLCSFTCNECGDIFKRKDNSKILRELKKRSIKMQNELKLIDEEIEKEEQIIDKRKQKEIEKENKKKKAKRKEKRDLKKKEKEKLKKKVKTSKKASKKKTKKPKKKVKTSKKASKKK